MMDKKGFLFTVTVFLVLTYILLTISVWVKGIEASERTFADFYKESTVELAIEQITPEKLDNVTYIIMNRNLARLNDHVVYGPVRDAESIDLVLGDLLANGSTNSDYFLDRGIPDESNSSLAAWASNLNASLLAIGVYISNFEVSSFTASQSDYRHFNYSFNITLHMKDFTNTSSVSRTYSIENEIDISGYVDAALARESGKYGQTIYRQFFFHDFYGSPSDIEANEIRANIYGGQGWLYGPVALANGTADHIQEARNIFPSNREQYILVGTFDEIRGLGQEFYGQFGGYIITDAPEQSPDSCGLVESNTFSPVICDESQLAIGFPRLDKPFIVAPGFRAENAELCPLLDSSGTLSRCLLFINSYGIDEVSQSPERKRSAGDSGIYTVEIVRDYVMCGYYTNNDAAPSFLQRMLDDSYSLSSEHGIETFVIGNYASDAEVFDTHSRLDRELYHVVGLKIRGLPGCKNAQSCDGNEIVGVFALSEDHLDDYGLEEIACEGCD
ncbi:hypothetical protein JXA56_02265 [Candidatus Micrarchaeota archaeon]|nr:hypothetical protein [Candidatus Micrarchaeota archaeon]